MSTLFGLLAFLLFVLIHPLHLADGHLQSLVESTDRPILSFRSCQVVQGHVVLSIFLAGSHIPPIPKLGPAITYS